MPERERECTVVTKRTLSLFGQIVTITFQPEDGCVRAMRLNDEFPQDSVFIEVPAPGAYHGCLFQDDRKFPGMLPDRVRCRSKVVIPEQS